ncbi:unnamed protein product [marine sediment metagenome]|uniref:50S ribosomal protein L13 n=1 Tax=marine sediment metagenome TaxID=412755 RepID=X1G6T6_9ZZZZ
MDYTIDAKNKKLGRVASEIATILQGKHDPSYDPRLVGSDRVVVKNVKQVEVSGDKEDSKVYYRHSGRPGHLKKRTYRQMFERNPAWVLRHAVYLMLPKNRLRKRRIKRLIIE